MRTRRKFYSKVLLFGEYMVTLDGEAFAIPNKAYFGRWEYGLPDDILIRELNNLAEYTNQLPIDLSIRFDREEWLEDMEHGMYFKSNIPVGYGLGSSGALVAAFYNRFFSKPAHIPVHQLISELGAIESYYHGISSGFDPLVCFKDQAVFLNEKKEIQLFDASQFELVNQIKLLDTKIERNTSSLMQIFKRKLEDAHFKTVIVPALKNANIQAIKALLSNNAKELEKAWAKISELQFLYFSEMIPESFKFAWEVGLSEHQFLFKLCGAGGGGYLLCFFPGNKGEGILLLNGIRTEIIQLEE